MQPRSSVPFWRNEVFLKWLGQGVFLVALGAFFWIVLNNMLAGLQRQGLALGFSFLNSIASFDIAESLIPYDRTSSYLRAFQVGLLNTVVVSLTGIVFATLLGVILGVARLSRNWLVNRLAALYLEAFRNIPLLVFLIFWYLGVFLKLPRPKDAMVLPGGILLSNRGIGLPWLVTDAGWLTYRWILLLAVILALALVFWLRRRFPLMSTLAAMGWGGLLLLGMGIAGWLMLPAPPLRWDYPAISGLRLSGGKIFSPEFMALTSGLILYTAAFIGEVVRAGILSVSKGQVEAAYALGLTPWLTLRLIIFPQALRVIIPPLTSQYLNLTKNSSLAIAIGYPDVFYVSGTIINQSGRAVEVIAMVMGLYLSLSLLTAAFMNWYNKKVQLVER